MNYKISSPVSVILPRKTKKDKVIYLNLNVYRNTHFQILNQIKVRYKELILPQLESLPEFAYIHTIEYIWYPKINNRSDVSNVCCIIDKFFCDALVESGHLPDDNHNFIKEIRYKYGEVNKLNPRVDIIINGEINGN